MPFESIQKLPDDPLLTIELSGLLVLRADANSTQCQVGVLNRAQGHLPSINLIVCTEKELPTIIPLHIGPLESEFTITVPGAEPKVFAYENEGNVEVDEPAKSFSWALPITKLHPYGYRTE